MADSPEGPMLVFAVPVGTIQQATALFSYPNVPGNSETLVDTIGHWVDQSLQCDGLATSGATSRVVVDGSGCAVYLQGPPVISSQLLAFSKKLTQFLVNGALALADISSIQSTNPSIWDPQKNGWRFMLPLGLPLVNQTAAQMFHYPPMNLLDPSQNYLDDAVPTRWAELLQANGLDANDAPLLERLLDCAPIAAGDDQGSLISQVLTPTDYFKDYQLAQLALFLTPSQPHPGYTIPLVVCGGPPRQVFGSLFGVTLGVNQALTVQIVPGYRTPVLGANHPYYFYAQAQGFNTVGSGKLLPSGCALATQIMTQDLIAARWQMTMANDPSQNPAAVLAACTAYWTDGSRAAQICALVQHEGTLFYPTGTPAVFTFNTSLAQGAAFCQSHDNNPCAQ